MAYRYHQPFSEAVLETLEKPVPPRSNNNLINGKMNYPCQNATGYSCTPNAGISKFFFTPGRRYLLRLINAGADGTQKFSIDRHSFTVVAQDFVPIKPYNTDLITLGVGQRSDVIVEAIGKAEESYWMRSSLGFDSNSCSLTDGSLNNYFGMGYKIRSNTTAESPSTAIAVAAVYYDGADENAIPTSNTSIPDARIDTCINDPLVQTEPSEAISSKPVGKLATQEFHMNVTNNGTAFVWFVNDESFRADDSQALLSKAQAGDLVPEGKWSVGPGF